MRAARSQPSWLSLMVASAADFPNDIRGGSPWQPICAPDARLATGATLGATLSLELGIGQAVAQTTKGGARSVDAALRRAVDSKEVPGVVAMANDKGVIYEGAFGTRDLARVQR